ncbi:hypothetical protein, partial [Pseudooctadecabacter sp.]|uniref:hypothetical protein n=1 Tax=Pseudooctadecabacter sp. TaxID=1966338 RepID=UPI0025DC07BB
MTRTAAAALLAAVTLGACAPQDIPSRLDSGDTLYSGFETADAYTPVPVGARADNDFMRFST